MLGCDATARVAPSRRRATSRFISSTTHHSVTACSTRNDTCANEPKIAAMKKPTSADLHHVDRLRGELAAASSRGVAHVDIEQERAR